jgi:para-nitrobenzyl esterase
MSRDRNRSRRLVLGGVALAAVLVAATTSGAGAAPVPESVSGPVVATEDGLVQGVATSTTDKFLGVPYAAPPVGALRWQPPQRPARWQGIRQTTTFGAHCPQPGTPFGKASTSEDCLFLNVFTPSHPHGPLPVMLWIHGGALVTGESDDYDPTNLVRDGVVVVTINYRLGALGFLAHPALTDDKQGASGDFGLMDQQAALDWVHENIGRFGGDNHNVTIFGESAGGLSVLSQLDSPGARGLFQRAIVESGSYDPTQQTLADAETSGEAFAAKSGCADQTAACLRNLPVTTILANEDQSGYTPDVDGNVLRQSVSTAFASGDFNRVPVIDGTNHDEWRLFVALSTLEGNPVTSANYLTQIETTLGATPGEAQAIASEYPLSSFPSPPLALGALGTDAIFACNAFGLDASLSKFVPTFAYEFNDPNPPSLLPPVNFPTGDAHASELAFVFNTANAPTTGGLDAGQLRLANTIQRYWTNFAARGDPSFAWPLFGPSGQRMRSLTEPRPVSETNFFTDHNCSFWTPAA